MTGISFSYSLMQKYFLACGHGFCTLSLNFVFSKEDRSNVRLESWFKNTAQIFLNVHDRCSLLTKKNEIVHIIYFCRVDVNVSWFGRHSFTYIPSH